MKKFNEMFVKMQTMARDEKGQTMVEYALLLALIAVVLVASLTGLKDAIAGQFTIIVGAL